MQWTMGIVQWLTIYADIIKIHICTTSILLGLNTDVTELNSQQGIIKNEQ